MNSMSVNIRKIIPADLDRVYPLADEFIEDTAAQYMLKLTAEHVRSLADKFMAHSFVMEWNGAIVGIFVGGITEHFLDGKEIYQEIIWFVSKPFRMYSIKLLDAAENYCKMMRIEYFVTACLINDNTERFKKLYKRRGAVPLELHFIKEVDICQ